MLAKSIPAHEADFRQKGVASNGRSYSLENKSIAIPGSDQSMHYVLCTPTDGDRSFFYNETVAKQKIVLHFTAGYLKGDVNALTKKDYHVSVPFLIGRDGTIFSLFPSMKWSYHLGKGAMGGNQRNSKDSVGIELSNIGPLKLSGNKLLTVYGDEYCSIEEEQYYTKIEEPFRGYSYFATFTEEQYQSLDILLKFLTARYQIPFELLPENVRFETNEENAGFKGIVSHINFRPSDKWDIGPGFEWERIVNGQ
ncbi:MAG: N-acetylmuramoyl-L-alanine amidase [Marinifilaceae bacterium]